MSRLEIIQTKHILNNEIQEYECNQWEETCPSILLMWGCRSCFYYSNHLEEIVESLSEY